MKINDLKTFYHGSKTKLPKKEVLSAHPADPTSFRVNSVLSQIVEKYRPSNQPSRFQCWFLSDSIMQVKMAVRSGINYIYEVEPHSPVFTHHYGWLCAAETISQEIGGKLWIAANREGPVKPFFIEGMRVAERQNENFVEYIKNYWNGVPLPTNTNELISVGNVQGTRIVEYTTDAIEVLRLAKKK